MLDRRKLQMLRILIFVTAILTTSGTVAAQTVEEANLRLIKITMPLGAVSFEIDPQASRQRTLKRGIMRSNAILAGIFIAILASPAAADGIPKPDAYTASYLSERTQIVDVISSVGLYADQRRWDLVEAAFAERAVIDYRSHGTAAAGQSEPQALTPKEIVAAWQTQLPGYLHTQHLVTNSIVTIDGTRARGISQVYATHYLPNEEGDDYWTFIGFYEHELQRTPTGWKITLMRANKLFELGNADLPRIAAAKVKAGQVATSP
jgi:hypothetical protein